MTLPVSPNSISLAQVNTELGYSSTATIDLTSSVVRTLFGVPTEPINILDGYGKSNTTYYSGTLTGSGTLSIPAGCTLVTLIGHGGYGGSNYDPGQEAANPIYGQPYIAPTAVTYKWDLASRVDYYDGWSATPFGGIGYPIGPTQSAPTQSYYVATVAYCGVSGSGYDLYTSRWWAMVDQPASAGQAYVAPGYYVPGQDYVAPSGGDIYLTATTATLNGTTRSWSTGLGTSTIGSTSTQTIASTSAGQTLTYAIAGAGALSYGYYA